MLHRLTVKDLLRSAQGLRPFLQCLGFAPFDCDLLKRLTGDGCIHAPIHPQLYPVI